MTVQVLVRITRTYDVLVDADYGDDDSTLIAKASTVLDDDDPTNDPPVTAELYSVIDNRFESKFDTLEEYNASEEAKAAQAAEDAG